MSRHAGILMPVSAISSDYGIGDFGPETQRFIELLKEYGYTLWQILPLTPLGPGNSPYAPVSSVAMDEVYISPDVLYREGLLEKLPTKYKSDRIDYDRVRREKLTLLMEAFTKFVPNDAYVTFIHQRDLYAYTVYQTLRKRYEGVDWCDWPQDVQDGSKIDERWYEDEDVQFALFVQYQLHHQWSLLRIKAKELGVEIFGDLPFYVGYDSSDVWANRDEFLLDEHGHQLVKAGVPGDYFNPEGQLWGNPIYNWEYAKANGFKFWMNRLRAVSELYDSVRLDHFRALDTYWQIPADSYTALVGEWIEAPGKELLAKVQKELPQLRLAAEDLGYLRQEAYDLRDEFGLSGMRVIQYDMEDKPIYPKETLLYSGTHDNMPLLAWWNSLPQDYQSGVRAWLDENGHTEEPVRALVHAVLDSPCDMVIISIVDLLGLDEKARLNEPGTMNEVNWSWQLSDIHLFEQAAMSYVNLLKQSRRY